MVVLLPVSVGATQSDVWKLTVVTCRDSTGESAAPALDMHCTRLDKKAMPTCLPSSKLVSVILRNLLAAGPANSSEKSAAAVSMCCSLVKRTCVCVCVCVACETCEIASTMRVPVHQHACVHPHT